MDKRKRVTFTILAIFFIMIFNFCAGEKKDWEKALENHTREAYESFLKNHPESIHENEARTQLEKIAFDEAMGKKTLSAYQRFISRYPNSPHLYQVYNGIQMKTVKCSFKVILARSIMKVTGLGKKWEVKDKEHNKGVAVFLELSKIQDEEKGKDTPMKKDDKFFSFSTSRLYLATYGKTDETLFNRCSGIGMGKGIAEDYPDRGLWFFGDEKSAPGLNLSRKLFRKENLNKVWLLFAVPKEAKQAAIFHGDIQICPAFEIKMFIPPAKKKKSDSSHGSRFKNDNEGGLEGGVEGGVEDGVLGGVLDGVEISPRDIETVRLPASRKPRLVKKVDPKYPADALKAKIQGRVIIDLTIDIYGKVKSAKVISGHPLLNPAALQAVKQWVFEPHILKGGAKPVKFVVKVNFLLKRDERNSGG